ncbi:uncharacterized protein N7459_000587 [Penicillium hispanicum]|uniref:uncharacterized protein n=1 Tax=Penicillium hispanicum TaxID=1080232 RepID=UPI0025409F41|nr:uncharacterized protein N7459_000587 [Penicillium hispanicum]KAJ5594379.1 hypothetical protein N7459_000587 [Penicillium hispanicum]
MVSLFGWGSSSKSDANASKTQDNVPSDQPPLSSSPSTPPSQPAAQSTQQSQQPATRDRTNLKLLLGGMAFFTLSLLVTRRANQKKRIACIPPFYTGSIYFQPKVNGAGEALEALNLATINVLSFGMMATGAVMCALDVNGIEDARRVMRTAIEGSTDGTGKSDEVLEQEVTEWVTSVLGDRFQKQLEKERAKKQLEAGQKEKDD